MSQEAFNYTPPVQSTSNQNAGDLAALVERLVQERLSASGVPEPPVVLSPEESARKALDNAGFNLGLQEQLSELYRHLDTIAKKVGI